MATISTNWPVRSRYQDQDGFIQYGVNNEHFLANRYSASSSLQQQDTYPYNTDRRATEIPASPSTPRYTSYATKKSLPLLSPAPAWHQLRVPAWLEAHDQVLISQQQQQQQQQEPPAPPPSLTPVYRPERDNSIEDEQQALLHQPQRDIFHDWLSERDSKQSEKHVRKVVLTDTKRLARAQRIAEAKVRNREKRERWRALARKVEEDDNEDLGDGGLRIIHVSG